MLNPVSQSSIASASIKTHGSEARTAAGHSAADAQPDVSESQLASAAPTIGLSGSTVLANVNAVTATAASRTVLQLLAFAIAAQLNMSRRDDESMDAFFLRLATAISNMKDNDRAALEIRSGLKALNIRLTDLAEALKAPGGSMAARIVALAEAPRTPFARAAAIAATSSYLQQGPVLPRAAEAFSIEAVVRANEISVQAPNAGSGEGEARGLQSQLKSMFEPGASTASEQAAGDRPANMPMEHPADADGPVALKVADPEVVVPDVDTDASMLDPHEPVRETETPRRVAKPETAVATVAAEGVDSIAANEVMAESEFAALAEPEEQAPEAETKTPNPKHLDRPDGARLRDQVQLKPAIGEKLIENRTVDKHQVAERRLEAVLVQKAVAEVVVAKSTNATDLIASQPNPADLLRRRATGEELPRAVVAEALAKIEKAVATASAAIERHKAVLARATPEEDEAEQVRRKTKAEDMPQSRAANSPDMHAPARIVTEPVAIPFAYAPALPAKDEFHASPLEDEHPEGESEGDDMEGDEAETGEERRERLARKAVDDLLTGEPEEPLTVAVTRDSSESDRAYAMYQRMGGF
ncbi:hypothetical protein JJB09_00325 [Rhizobium sp. KVB221]|uniref:Uncharacterized protein n=1 Tax=Rhizobium setariae TaxID=2801340 RepID=A0A937CKH1_9HYPH|nr:hypothetical protein [Rhizobium setariae]MBL0370461.1 hypothetical protein [Rhizobium setariae]